MKKRDGDRNTIIDSPLSRINHKNNTLTKGATRANFTPMKFHLTVAMKSGWSLCPILTKILYIF